MSSLEKKKKFRMGFYLNRLQTEKESEQSSCKGEVTFCQTEVLQNAGTFFIFCL